MFSKSRLRTHLRRERAELINREERQKKIDIALSTMELPVSVHVAVYAAINNEVSVDALVNRLVSAQIAPLYPRIDGQRMSFVPAHPQALRSGFKNILEAPSDIAPYSLKDITVFIVPGLGFTPEGHRLGYGGGFYDRTLQEAISMGSKALRVGLAFEVQIVSSLPSEPHDVAMTHLLTEEGLRPCSPK